MHDLTALYRHFGVTHPFWRMTGLLFIGVLALASPLNGGERMAMRLTPSVALAPGFFTVSVMVEADDENRSLEVVAESPDFYRRSEISLDGKNAPRLNVFELRSLPTGLYQVTSVLVGAHGQRAIAQRVAKVEPSPGYGR